MSNFPVYIVDAFQTDNNNRYIPVGALKQHPIVGCIMFQYSKQYLKLGNKAISVDPVNLPLKEGWQNLGKHGLGAIRDTAPDYWGRTVINECFNWGPCEHNLEYIILPNPARLGNIEFAKQKKEYVKVAELPDIFEVFKKIEKNLMLDEWDREILQEAYHCASIGGGRPKCVASDENGILWVVKFKSKNDVRPEARIEDATMKLAKYCDINVAETHIGYVNGHSSLFVKRFDRDENGKRIGFMSAHSVLQMGLDKNADERSRDYRLLCEKIKKFGDKNDLLELFKRIAFNIIVRNLDDHERNHGFLLKNGKLSLSPAYDVIPSGNATDMSHDAFLCMTIGKGGKRANKENLLTSVDYFDLSKDEGETIFDKVAETIALKWQDVFAENKIKSDELGGILPVLEYWSRKYNNGMVLKNG